MLLLSDSVSFHQYAPGLRGPKCLDLGEALSLLAKQGHTSPFFPRLQPGACALCLASKLKAHKYKSPPKTLVSLQAHKPPFAISITSCSQWWKGQSLQWAPERIPGNLRDPIQDPSPRTPPSFSSQLPLLCNPDQHGSKLSPTQPFCTLLRSTARLLQRTGCLYRLPSSDSLLIL